MKHSKIRKNNQDTNIVYSTPNLSQQREEDENYDETDEDVFRPQDYSLGVRLEKKGRGGKTATIIKGFDPDSDAAHDWAKKLKSHCGVGGSVTEDGILIQGDQVEKILTFLKKNGFNVKKIGG